MKIINKTRLLAVKGNSILVLEKIDTPIKLSFAGGISKKKETLEETLVRETMEEIGFKINPNDLTFFKTKSKTIDNTIIVKHYYKLKTNSDAFKVIETEKFKAVYWIKWKDAIEYLDKEDRKATKEYFTKKVRRNIKLLKRIEKVLSQNK
ncbi:NUDIX domain-containing protein [uncultured Lacinutrix sp.]|uniref:NUDIX hydrolase n=1 Tax=uncultured Lacinutrix sp. TaxID=574032 RepID=UPI00261FC6AE|nr:NUDIX domain-containing protein [uncultured Lacinutrix sp.]